MLWCNLKVHCSLNCGSVSSIIKVFKFVWPNNFEHSWRSSQEPDRPTFHAKYAAFQRFIIGFIIIGLLDALLLNVDNFFAI